jgi:hypothetical protein
VSHEVSVIQGQYLLGGLISLWAVIQARQCLEVAVELFNPDKKLLNQNPMWLLQRVCDIILEGLTCIMMEHLLKMKHDALAE